MDGERFDALTRALGGGRSRRGVLKGLGAAALGVAGLGRIGQAEARASRACVRFCQTLFPPGSARNACVRDADNGRGACLACGGDPNRYCDGACVDYASDPTNCGGCGAVCPPVGANATATCSGGACGIACDAGYADCDGDPSNGCEIYIWGYDVENCGGCGYVCDTPDHGYPICYGSVCGYGCDVGYADNDEGCIASCNDAVLSGSPDGLNPICVDDQITVFIDGSWVIYRSGPISGCVGVIPIGFTDAGDQIRVRANNGSAANGTCGQESLSPLYLVCRDNGASQTLDAIGVIDDGQDHPCDEVFYDRTFTTEF